MGSKLLMCTIGILLLVSCGSYAARILAIVPIVSRSHHIWNSALTVALARRGHQITAISPDPPMENHPNLKHIIIEGAYERVQEVFHLEEWVEESDIEALKAFWKWGLVTCKLEIQTKGAKELLRMPPDSFDLIITEVHVNECFYLYLDHFGGGTRIPVVGISAFGIAPWIDLASGSRTMPSVFAFPTLPYLSKMNFWERMKNTFITGLEWIGMMYYYLPQQQRIAEEAYGKPLPPLQEFASNISLFLMNNHYALNGPQQQLPGVVDVGGMQCSPPKPLPKDIQSFLDGAEQGAIFFSLGSNLRSEKLPKEKLQILLDTFAALGPKVRVLWKFDPKVPIKGLPSNVLIKKWLPQEDVLGHPKVLAFVSHSGLLSTMESIYHGKPVVSIPFFLDQFTNMRRMVEMKVAEHVDFVTITKESFTAKVLKVINDPSYRRNMQTLSNMLRDQPETPLDRAVFWVEFTLRHGKGGRVEALRYAGLDLAWYQYFSLDVLAVFAGVIMFAVLAVVFVIRALCRCFVKPSHRKDSSKKRQ
ncbi:UDP-glucosyltransferase 2-like [Ischnura elegans]|uniref:UDP-glucosyltransferase 2-like n=1 Tax=Ischnura elegans TaxID=197161 RepID=UPI001ED88F88|nr:UDP-glucosyltransferase 2-like [Ischnura elegans]